MQVSTNAAPLFVPPPPVAAKPIISKRAAPISAPAKPEPHPIYGNVPIGKDGCTLEAQPIEVLNRWHEKAIEASDAYWARPPKNKPDDDPEYDPIYNAKWNIFAAAFKAKANHPSGVSALMQIVARHCEDAGETDGIITLDRVKAMATAGMIAAAPIFPTKALGKLNRGKKLTRAGLLFRYQSFLVQELMTLSWALYGHPRYAMNYIFFDDEVTKRCSDAFRKGRPKPYRRNQKTYPFFDESKLADRARSVLKSLKIDTKQLDVLGRHSVTWATSESWPSRAAK